MPDLDACYFCGGVEDVTREPVLAEDRTAPDTDVPTVALCPSCRDRLGAILDALNPDRPDPDDTTTDATTASTTIDVQPGDSTPDQADEETQTSEDDPVAGDDDPPEQGVTIDPPDDEQEPDAAVDRPQGYGKVLRFLRNRELPMARTRVVELVGSAYELRHDEVEAVLDYAIDHDTLEETDGEIRRP